MRALGQVRVFLHFFAIGVQLLNCIPLSDFFRHTSIFYKKARSCVYFRPVFPQSASILSLHQRRTHRPEAKASGQCVLPFCYSSRPNGQNGGALGSTAARSTVTIQSADGTIYVQGTSDVTVTVSSYTTQIDTTGASTVDSWNSYAA